MTELNSIDIENIKLLEKTSAQVERLLLLDDLVSYVTTATDVETIRAKLAEMKHEAAIAILA